MNKKGQLGAVIGIIGIIVIITAVYLIATRNDQETFIQFRFYDENKNPIIQDALAVTVPLASYMDATITVTNTGATPLSCVPVKVSPPELDAVLVRSPKVVPSTGIKKASWTSGLINMSLFTGRPTQRFNVTLRCSYNLGQEVKYLADKQGYLDLLIQPACGNKYCETGETADSCPQDCWFGGKVKFRTSNLLYPRDTIHAVAFRDYCGNSMIKYDYLATVCTSSMSSTCPARLGMTLMIDNSQLPGKPVWANTNGCLYMNNSNPNYDINIYWKVATVTNSPCPTVNTWGGYAYHKNDASTLVSSNPILEDSSKEVAC